jgi:hypothetical protein
MTNLVIVAIASEESGYSAEHIRLLLRRGQVEGRKIGGTWLVDLEDLRRHQRAMTELGRKKFDPTRGKSGD